MFYVSHIELLLSMVIVAFKHLNVVACAAVKDTPGGVSTDQTTSATKPKEETHDSAAAATTGSSSSHHMLGIVSLIVACPL